MKEQNNRYKREREIAIQAAIQATKVCRAVQKNIKSAGTTSKQDNSPVTIADFASQAIINLQLNKHFPNDLIIGEEDSSKLRESETLKSRVLKEVRKVLPSTTEEEILQAIDLGNATKTDKGRVWAIDPIDGTKGFLREEQYAIAIALIESGRVVLGVLGCPNLPDNLADISGEANKNNFKGCIAVGVLGKGAYMRGYKKPQEKPIRVTQIKETREAWFVESVESGHSSHEVSSLIANKLGITKPPVRLDSQTKYAVLARGDAPIYLRIPAQKGYLENIWDHAAGSIIVEEAGGKVTDAYGKPLDFSLGRKLKANTGIVATNGLLHNRVIQVTRKFV